MRPVAARLGAIALLVIAMTGQAGAVDTADDGGAVQRLISDAVTEYDAGHFDEARALFRSAHAQAPSARTLRGIGMASFELRDYVEATRTLTAALAERRRALTPDQRRHVAGLLGRAEAFVGRFAVHLTPSDASLSVDGKPAQREPDGALLLPFGHHRVVAGCPTCADADRGVEVLGGERQEITFALASASGQPLPTTTATTTTTTTTAANTATTAAAGAASGAATATVIAAPTPVAEPTSARPSAARYWFGGAAVLGVAGAVGAGLWWRDRAGQLDDCRAAGARCQNQQVVERQRNTAVGVTLGLAATAVTAGIIAAVLWTRHDSSANQTQQQAQALACVPGPKGVTCAIRF